MPSHVEEAAALLNKKEYRNSASDVLIPMPELPAEGVSKQHGDISTNAELSSSISPLRGIDSEAEQEIPGVLIAEKEIQHLDVFQEPERVDSQINKLNSQLLDAIINQDNEAVERLLDEGASPNATCRANKNSACHVAAYYNSDALKLLIKYNAITNRRNNDGSTPLHFAALAGNNQNIAILLNLPIDLQNNDEPYLYIRSIPQISSSIIDVTCLNISIPEVEESWRDSLDHNCEGFMASVIGIKSGWTPLHVASFAGHNKSTRLLLAAGANSNIQDLVGDTPLAVAGDMFNLDIHTVEMDRYVATIKSLLEYRSTRFNPQEYPQELGSALLIAVKLCCEEAVQLLLEAGAPVTQHERLRETPPDNCLQAQFGYTAMHLAARKGNLVILNLILDVVQNIDAVNYGNDSLETPLICAIRSGNLDCVKALINKGASLQCNPTPGHKLSDQEISEIYNFFEEHEKDRYTSYNSLKSVISCNLVEIDKVINNNMIFHAAWIQTSEVDFVSILEYLLDFEKSLECLLEYRCPEIKYMLPLEVAAFERKPQIYKFLFKKSVDRAKDRNEKFDPILLWLNINAMIPSVDLYDYKVFYDTLKTTIDFFPDSVQIMPRLNVFIFHAVIERNNREMILLQIKNGADLSVRDHRDRTAISLLIPLSNSVKFLESIFDDCVSYSGDFENAFISNVRFNYSVLAPTPDGQMKVLKALLDTGNYKGQKELLMHPLVESFLYKKWQAYTKYYFLIISFYVFFAVSLSVLIVSVFYYKDQEQSLPNFCNPLVWSCLTYVSLSIIVSQELSCFSTKTCFQTWPSRESTFECLVKCGSFVLAIVTPLIITKECEKIEWWRYMAAVTLALAWSNIMIMLSKTPTAGYYMQMFWRVSFKIIKILLTFSSLIIMFSLCFMVLSHTQAPFDGPFAAFIKTLVMMTSEFEYEDNFSKVEPGDVFATVMILRFVFVVFLIVTAIVLMNLMTGVAVSDANALIYEGNLRRLEMQVEFLYALEVSRQNNSVFNILSLHKLFKSDKVPTDILFWDYERNFDEHIRQGITNKAQEHLNKKKNKLETNKHKAELNEILKATSKNEEIIKNNESKLDIVVQNMGSGERIQEALSEILRATSRNTENIKKNEVKLNELIQNKTQHEQIHTTLNEILHALNKLDQKLTEQNQQQSGF